MILKGIKIGRQGKTKPAYTSAMWKKYSKGFIMMNPVCVVCGNEAKVVDHVVPIEQGGSMWNEKNHQALCKSCHGKKNNSDKEYYGIPRY